APLPPEISSEIRPLPHRSRGSKQLARRYSLSSRRSDHKWDPEPTARPNRTIAGAGDPVLGARRHLPADDRAGPGYVCPEGSDACRSANPLATFERRSGAVTLVAGAAGRDEGGREHPKS